ncbi:MAG: LysR family transcriptional regulator substrate-binding protein [Desulfobacteraceae bacterium]|nr:LysR family transcriptional regulator substrate-binding protein [Desulfobacteraceae bacterium]
MALDTAHGFGIPSIHICEPNRAILHLQSTKAIKGDPNGDTATKDIPNRGPALKLQPHGSISIRIPQTLGTYRLPDILQRFKARYPKVGFNVSTCASYTLEQELKAGIIDVAFLLADSINALDLKSEVLAFEPLVLVAAPDHPLAARPAVTVNDLAGESILLPKHDCGYRMQFETMLSERQIQSTTITELNSIEAIKQCVLRGIGITIIPQIAVANEIARKQLIPLAWADDTVESAVLMIQHKDKWVSPVLETFMDISRKVCK